VAFAINRRRFLLLNTEIDPLVFRLRGKELLVPRRDAEWVVAVLRRLAEDTQVATEIIDHALHDSQGVVDLLRERELEAIRLVFEAVFHPKRFTPMPVTLVDLFHAVEEEVERKTT